MIAISVLGTTSSAGKSLLATALCRALSRRGLSVCPFKAVNMSNNARVVAGGEIGAAQYLQALAAGVTPSVAMNPVLVKPEGDARSQVVVMGEVHRPITDTPWRDRAALVWPIVRDAYDALAATHDVMVIEGAGSPAEINLADVDLANLAMLRHADARALLVSDIDRGGSFAHLYGTWALLEPGDRDRIVGFVLNRFRGDVALLAPGPELLERRTGVPVLGVVPMVDHGLPDEDGAADWRQSRVDGPAVAIVRGPAASNLDEYAMLGQVCRPRWAHHPADLDRADLIVLPGSKHTGVDRAWLRATGLDHAVVAAAGAGVPIIGVCGGMQLLGGAIHDPGGHETSAPGLGLLDLETVHAPRKQVTRSRLTLGALNGPWNSLSGLAIDGYEIHTGTTRVGSAAQVVQHRPLTVQHQGVLGTYLHGLFEDPMVLARLFGVAPRRSLDSALDALGDLADDHLDVDRLLSTPS